MFVCALCASARRMIYVSRITRRRSGISSRSGCANRRCSRILRNVSTNRLRSARRAEARTNSSCKAFRDGVDGGSTMQAWLQDGRPQPQGCLCARCARRLWVIVGRMSQIVTPSETSSQALAGAGRIEPVGQGQIYTPTISGFPSPSDMSARTARGRRRV